eukprot:gene25144-30364_t
MENFLTLHDFPNVDVAFSSTGHDRILLKTFYTSNAFALKVYDDDYAMSSFGTELGSNHFTFLKWLLARDCPVEGLEAAVDEATIADLPILPCVGRCRFSSSCVSNHDIVDLFKIFPNLTQLELPVGTLESIKQLSVAPSSIALSELTIDELKKPDDLGDDDAISAACIRVMDRFKNSLERIDIDELLWTGPMLRFMCANCEKMVYIPSCLDANIEPSLFVECLALAGNRIEEIRLEDCPFELSDRDILEVAPKMTALNKILLSGPNISLTYLSALALHKASLTRMRLIELSSSGFMFHLGVKGCSLVIATPCGLQSERDFLALFQELPPISSLSLYYCQVPAALARISGTLSLRQSLKKVTFGGQCLAVLLELLPILSSCENLTTVGICNLVRYTPEIHYSDNDWSQILASFFTHGGRLTSLNIESFPTGRMKELIDGLPRLTKFDISSLPRADSEKWKDYLKSLGRGGVKEMGFGGLMMSIMAYMDTSFLHYR